MANSFLVSCDNAHAIHPNHPEYTDKGHGVALNGGVVLKHNANQRYTTDAVSAAIFRTVCAEAGVAVQDFTNRADLAGGSTLGNIANTQVSLNTVDIGLPQLAMHSAWETAGAEDTESLVKALTVFYGKTLQTGGDGVYRLICYPPPLSFRAKRGIFCNRPRKDSSSLMLLRMTWKQIF